MAFEASNPRSISTSNHTHIRAHYHCRSSKNALATESNRPRHHHPDSNPTAPIPSHRWHIVRNISSFSTLNTHFQLPLPPPCPRCRQDKTKQDPLYNDSLRGGRGRLHARHVAAPKAPSAPKSSEPLAATEHTAGDGRRRFRCRPSLVLGSGSTPTRRTICIPIILAYDRDDGGSARSRVAANSTYPARS